MLKQQIVDYIDAYIAAFARPALEGVTVAAVRRNDAGG